MDICLAKFKLHKNLCNNVYLNYAQVVLYTEGVFHVTALNPSNCDVQCLLKTSEEFKQGKYQ